MEYVNYKKIHRHNTRNVRITIVEWPGGGITLDKMGRVAKGVWSGASMHMTDVSARRIKNILGGIFARRLERR